MTSSKSNTKAVSAATRPLRKDRGWSYWIGRSIVVLILALVCLIGWGVFSQYRTESATAVVSSSFGDANDLNSVNGFGVFSRILEAKGCQLHPTSILAPQLEEHDVLVWFHNSIHLPQPEAFERVEEWLSEGNRTVVFVGNDHNAKVPFLESVYRNSEIQDQRWARVVARMEKSREGQSSRAYESSNLIPYRRFYDGQGCDWFNVNRADNGFVGQYSMVSEGGSSEVDTVGDSKLPTVRVHNYLKPNLNHEVLISCSNGSSTIPIVTRLRPVRRSSKVLLVSSASFMSNYGTALPENQPLMNRLLDEIPDNSQVQVLESGPQDVPLSSTPEDRLVKTWTWMKHGLFPIAVLHVLTFAVIFCFARYPVFGRPKELQFEPRNDFGLHLEEVGRLLRDSREENFAKQKIQHYFEVVKRSLIGRGPNSRS